MRTLGTKLQIQIDKPTAGSLDLSSKASAVECGTVVTTPDNSYIETIYKIKVGDKLLFKAWAVDIINYEGETYYFIDADSKGICAII